jgi:hydrogenase-4 membrane subunit HyfE
MELLQSPFIIPLGAFVTVIAVVVVESLKKLREKELEAQRELRLREMEHLQRMKELDVAFERDRTRARA